MDYVSFASTVIVPTKNDMSKCQTGRFQRPNNFTSKRKKNKNKNLQLEVQGIKP